MRYSVRTKPQLLKLLLVALLLWVVMLHVIQWFVTVLRRLSIQ
jgi:hypothetical protein